MAGLLVRVRTTMSLFAHRKTLDLLEGGYASIHRARSHDFDDLREYVSGDEVKDIDWKATARHGQPLVKRYVAARRHRLILAVDAGRNMAATAESGESKKSIAILAAGGLASIATAHGDEVALVAGDADGVRSSPPGQDDAHLERLLRTVDERITLDAGRSDVFGLLEHVARHHTRRSLVLVVTDDVHLDDEILRLLRRLRTRHEVVWLTIGDADLMRPAAAPVAGDESGTGASSRRSGSAGDRGAGTREVFDVQEVAALPAYVRSNRALRTLFAEAAATTVASTDRELRQLGVSAQRIASQADVLPGLLALLEKHRRADR